MTRTNKIYTLRDARAEKIAHDERQVAREMRAARKIVARMPHERADKLHPRVGTLNRWDEKGMPFYYIIDRGIVIESTNLGYLASIAEGVLS